MTEIRFKPSAISENLSANAANQSAIAANRSADAVNQSADAVQTSAIATKVGRGPLSGNKRVNELGYDSSSGEIVVEVENGS